MSRVTRYPMISKTESGRVSKEIPGSGSGSGTRWALVIGASMINDHEQTKIVKEHGQTNMVIGHGQTNMVIGHGQGLWSWSHKHGCLNRQIDMVKFAPKCFDACIGCSRSW